MIFEVLKSLGFPLAFFTLINTFRKGVLPFSKGFCLGRASKRETFLAWNSEISGKFSQNPVKNTDLALAMSTKLYFLFYLVYKVSRIHFEVKWKLLGQIRVASCMDPLFFALSRHAYPSVAVGAASRKLLSSRRGHLSWRKTNVRFAIWCEEKQN